MNEVYWITLLRHWDAKGRVGLSIPFIVGAQTIFNKKYEPQPDSAIKLLSDLFQIKVVDGIFKIDWCDEICTPIIGFVNNNYRKYQGAGLYFPKGAEENYRVFVSSRILQDFNTQEEQELIERLSESVVHAIKSRNYSKRRYGWIGFEGTDIKEILQALHRSL
jgi:Mor family transcriptional regulator